MNIGIGIPNSVPGATGPQLLDWARRAEQAGFSSLATIGALSFPSYEELTVLGAAGAVTEHIGLFTNILITPARSAAELAKQSATVQQLSSGRLTLGLGVGWRASDYLLAGRSFEDRGRHFDVQPADLKRAWAGQPLANGTKPAAPDPGQRGEVPMLIGGMTDATIRRVVEHGVGWTAGGAPPDVTSAFMQRVRTAWQQAGRQGSPRFAALGYFGLGNTEELSRRYLLDYYEPRGDMAQLIAGSALRSGDAIRQTVAVFGDLGVDEFIFSPTVSDPQQVDLLAETVL